MSVLDHRWAPRLSTQPTFQRLTKILFGDRIGVVIFLAALAFTTLYWRVGFFINDNYTIANTLVNIAEGHLHITHVIYGPESGATPGVYLHDGRLYGRNYGLVFAALPFLWLLQALSYLADIRIVLIALWSLLLLGLALHLGAVVDRRRPCALVGSIAAVLMFGLNTAIAPPLDTRWLAMLALQLSTMVWTALLGVVVYRLTTHIYDRHVGVAAGIATVIATPIGFWASIPKRHVLITLLAVCTIYCFYRSRADPTQELRFRALTYVFVGLSAWVFPLEALLLLAALGPLDLLTARTNSPRHLAIIGAAFGLSLLPFLITNTLITGNPLKPPGLLPVYRGEEQIFTAGTESSGGTGGSAETTGGTGGGTGDQTGSTITPSISIIALAASTLDAAVARLDLLWTNFFDRSIRAVRDGPSRVYHTFIRSGYIDRVAARDGGEAVNLALLESAPLLGAVLALPAAMVTAVRTREDIRAWAASAVGQTDLFIGSYIWLLTLAYISRLPLHAMVTVRYLLPILPGLIYLTARLTPVRAAIRTAGRSLLVTYAAGVLIGGQLLVLVLLVAEPSLGEAVQLHAWLGLVMAVPLGAWALAATLRDGSHPRVGAVCLGLAGAATTVFILLSGVVYFAYAGEFALPVVQRLTEALPI